MKKDNQMPCSLFLGKKKRQKHKARLGRGSGVKWLPPMSQSLSPVPQPRNGGARRKEEIKLSCCISDGTKDWFKWSFEHPTHKYS